MMLTLEDIVVRNADLVTIGECLAVFDATGGGIAEAYYERAWFAAAVGGNIVPYNGPLS